MFCTRVAIIFCFVLKKHTKDLKLVDEIFLVVVLGDSVKFFYNGGFHDSVVSAIPPPLKFYPIPPHPLPNSLSRIWVGHVKLVEAVLFIPYFPLFTLIT